jgi:hypothetical protein
VSIDTVPGIASEVFAVMEGFYYTFKNMYKVQDFTITPPLMGKYAFGSIVDPNTIHLYKSDSSATPSTIMARGQN